MPQISSNSKGGVVRWDADDWLSGLTPDWGLNETETTIGKGFSTSTGIDPFRRPGYLSPGYDPLSATNNSVIDAMQKNGVVYGAYAYTIGGDKLHKMDILTNTIVNDIGSGGYWPHTISAHGGHSSVVGSDVAIYYVGSTPYLFYSWSDGTDGDVGRFDLSSTFDDDWMSTVPTSAAVQSTTNPHVFVQGTDNRLYISNGRYMNQFYGQSGGNGTYSEARLKVPTDSIITSFAKTGDNLVLFAYKSTSSYSGSYYKGECAAYFWDYSSEDPWKVIPIPGNYINGGFSMSGIVGCFVQGAAALLNSSGKQSRLFMYDGSVFSPKVGFIDNIPGHGGVEVIDDVIYWNAASYIYQYGSPHLGLKGALNRITKLDGSTSEGMLRNFANTTMVGSAGTTSSGGMQKVNSGYYAGTCITPTVNLPFQPDTQARIKMVKVFWYAPKTAGSNKLTLKVLTDRAQNNSTIIDTSGTVGDDRQSPPASCVSIYRDEYDATGFPTASAMALQLTYSEVDATKLPALIQAVEVNFEYENI